MSTLCGAVRPRDGATICNEPAGHAWDHHSIGDPLPDGDSGSVYRPHLATWAQDGTETCAHCGHKLDAQGFCTAPRSAAD